MISLGLKYLELYIFEFEWQVNFSSTKSNTTCEFSCKSDQSRYLIVTTTCQIKPNIIVSEYVGNNISSCDNIGTKIASAGLIFGMLSIFLSESYQ